MIDFIGFEKTIWNDERGAGFGQVETVVGSYLNSRIMKRVSDHYRLPPTTVGGKQHRLAVY